MNLKIVLIFLGMSSSSIQLCESYAAPFYRPGHVYGRPSDYYEDLASTNGFNFEVARGNQIDVQQREQTRQQIQWNIASTDYQQNQNVELKQYKDYGTQTARLTKAKRPCTTWTSPEGIRFVLQSHTTEIKHRQLSNNNDNDCDSPSPRMKLNYSPSYYSPGSASDLFYDI